MQIGGSEVKDPEGPSSARSIAEHVSELINGMVRVVYPERFGTVSNDDVLELRSVSVQLRESIEDFTGWASPELNLTELSKVLPDLERVLSAGQEPERVATARAFLLLVLGSENLQRLVTGPEVIAALRRSISWLLPWQPADDADAVMLVHELDRELHRTHPLHGRAWLAVGRRIDSDDALFVLDAPYGLAVVHLPYATTVPEQPPFPTTRLYATVDDFVAECMNPDHIAYEATT